MSATPEHSGRRSVRESTDDARVPEFVIVGDEYSWEAVIAPDGGEVPLFEAERIFRQHGVDLPPEGPKPQRFREVEPSADAPWDREFWQAHDGPIHGWKVEV